MHNKYPIAFFGTPDFAATVLRSLLSLPDFEVQLVVTQPDSPAGRGAKLRASPVKLLAQEHEIPVLQPQSIKREAEAFSQAFCAGGVPCLSLVVAFGQILPLWLLQLCPRGFVNVHASLLPRWRGAAPIQRALMQGDSKTGVCLMQMEAGLDTGPVYSRAEIEISPAMDAGQLHDQLAQLACELIARDLVKIAANQLSAQPQIDPDSDPANLVTYAQRISNQECQLDWSASAEALHNRIRGLSPSPGAFTFLNGKRLKIYRSVVKSSSLEATTTCGRIVALTPEVLVACGSGILALESLQLEGRSRISAAEFVRGGQLEVGMQLGV